MSIRVYSYSVKKVLQTMNDINGMAGPEGFEPSLTVLETGVLPLTPWA